MDVFAQLVQLGTELALEAGKAHIQDRHSRASSVRPEAAQLTAGVTPPAIAGCPYCALWRDLWTAHGYLVQAKLDPPTCQGLAKKSIAAAAQKSADLATHATMPGMVELHRQIMRLELQLDTPQSADTLSELLAESARQAADAAFLMAARNNAADAGYDQVLDRFSAAIDQFGEGASHNGV